MIRAVALPAALLGGYLVWSAALVVLYTLHGAGCELVAPERRGVLRIAMFAAWLACVAAGVVLAVASARRVRHAGARGPARFLATVTVALAITGAIATAWTGLPLVLADPCRWPASGEGANGVTRTAAP